MMEEEGSYGAIGDENTPLISTQRSQKGLTRFKITIEPIKFILGFCMSYTSGVTIDILERNICYLKFNLTEDECFANMTPTTKSIVESMTADVNMVNQVIQGIFPLMLVLFVGSWSDTNGRKPFILAPLLGFGVYYLSWSILSYFPSIPIEYYYIPSIPLGMSGLDACFHVCSWSYICDNFDTRERPFRFSVCCAVGVTGKVLASSLSGQTVKWAHPYGYQVVFGISFVLMMIAFIYTLFFLEETINRPEGVTRTKLIDFENVKSTFMVILIKPEKGVLLSVLVVTVLFTEIIFNAGDDGILYLVGKTQYDWSLEIYNIIVVLVNLVSATIPVYLIWLLMKVLNWRNESVLIAGLVIFVISEVLSALSPNQVVFWTTTLIKRVGQIAGPTVDTELSNIAAGNNAGKAFSMMSICDALTPLMALPLYTEIYSSLMPHHTLNVFFTSAVLATLALYAAVGIFFKNESLF